MKIMDTHSYLEISVCESIKMSAISGSKLTVLIFVVCSKVVFIGEDE
jgi:hypothetical protein